MSDEKEKSLTEIVEGILADLKKREKLSEFLTPEAYDRLARALKDFEDVAKRVFAWGVDLRRIIADNAVKDMLAEAGELGPTGPIGHTGTIGHTGPPGTHGSHFDSPRVVEAAIAGTDTTAAWAAYDTMRSTSERIALYQRLMVALVDRAGLGSVADPNGVLTLDQVRTLVAFVEGLAKSGS